MVLCAVLIRLGHAGDQLAAADGRSATVVAAIRLIQNQRPRSGQNESESAPIWSIVNAARIGIRSTGSEIDRQSRRPGIR